MSYHLILADIHEEIHPQQNPDIEDDIEPDFFETEIQELSERLASVLARYHALNGQTACYSDFVLRPDITTYKRVHKEAWKAYEPEPYTGCDEF